MEMAVSMLLKGREGAVHTVAPETSVTKAVEQMNERNIGAVAVLKGDRLAGIFTERDVLRRVIGGHLEPDTTPVSEVMTAEVIVIKPETTVGEAMLLVKARNCRHLPVVEGGRMVGMVSVRDLIGALVEDREDRIAELTGYIYGNYGPHQMDS